MSDTILGGRWEIFYESETRQKRLHRATAVDPLVSDSVQSLYSALMDLFDSAVPASEGTPMKFDTPVQYKIGIIDSGDKDPWYVDKTSVEYLTGGSLETVGWLRAEGTNTGIVRVHCSSLGTIDSTDIGKAVTHVSGDAGTLLDIHTTLNLLTIRPASSAAGDNWDTGSGTITVTVSGHTATQDVAAVSGEQRWANIYTTGLATLQPNTVLGVYQDGAYLTRYKNTVDWWTTGDIDILVPLKDTTGTLIDDGYLTVKANRALTTYSYFIANVSSGGRNPIPLTCGGDLNNVYGYRQMVLSPGTVADLVVGEIIEDDTDETIAAIVTYADGAYTTGQTIQYYLIGGLDTAESPQQKDFSVTTGDFTGQTSGGKATAVAPTNVNGAAVAGMTITHGWTTADIDENGTNEYYSISVDCNTNTVADAYQWAQYVSRFGGTTTTNTDGIEGQQYIGSDYRLKYSGSVTGTIAEGVVVLQDTTLATGTVVAHNTTQKYIILRNSRGTFNTTDAIRDGGNSVVPNTYATVITPIVASPFGIFAGGTWFGAPGVVLVDVAVADVNKYQLTDDYGNTVSRPLKVTATVGNTREKDWIAVFELTAVGGVIKKDSYKLDATQPTSGSTTIVVSSSIDSKVPGKTNGGIIRLVDASDGWEYRYRYSSWATNTFTLFNTALTTSYPGGSATSLLAPDVDFTVLGVRRGDIVWDYSNNTYAYITTVASGSLTTTNISSKKPEVDWSVVGYRVGVTVDAHDPGNDKLFAPFIDTYETSGSEGVPGSEVVSVTYTADIPVRIKARHYEAGIGIVPFSGDAKIQSTGLNVNVIRTTDTVAT